MLGNFNRRIGKLSCQTRRFMSNFVIVNDESFVKLSTTPGKKVFYFTATWCPPCKKIAPIFEKISKDYPSITFAKIDVDDSPQAASANRVRSVPTFQFRSGEVILEEFAGANEASLRDCITALQSAK